MSRLVLSRKKTEKVRVGNDVEITVLRVAGGRVRLGITAPRDLPVLRHELSLSGTSSMAVPEGEDP